MAEQITHDVVKEAQSMGGASPIDDSATTTNLTSAGNGKVAPSTANNDAENPPRAESNPQQAETDGGRHVHSSMHTLPTTAVVETDGLLSTPDESNGLLAVADASGGSDTDTSRADSLDQAKDAPRGHARSNSVKKPTSFKSVSVTKNFLAKTAVAAPSLRGGEKGAGPGQANASSPLTAKPRLVAKSGSGLGSSVPRSGLSKLNGAGTGPDASKVWNKNRPVAPTPPRQFTDEELKQQYGIHMATRLQADEGGKESKWADIEDDEDDWAPETVEWMDGTKSTVTATENQQPPQTPEEAIVSEGRTDAPVEPVKPVTSTAPGPAPPSTAKTILKPGGHTAPAQTAIQSPKSGSLVLKGGPEKPTLVAKATASSAVKSPWAALPPVDKTPPVVINPSIQPQPPQRFQRDSHGFDALPPAPSPAKEIAADDFNRSWRDERAHKELFNSQSGRYEPVNEVRRGSVRHDHGFRQPAVLQRPTQNTQSGPAEPSAAFQTSRVSFTDAEGPWSRRRTSSNVSGGSGHPARRMSFNKQQDQSIQVDTQGMPRRGSQPFASSDVTSPGSQMQSGVSPSASNQQWPSQSPVLKSVQPASNNANESGGEVVQEPAPETAAEIAEKQRQLMHEKIERAKMEKQRQKEEEEREEVAKKERLRQKLAALEAQCAPPKDSKSKDVTPTQLTTASSPPKFNMSSSEGGVTQYGMMKVHQPHPVRKPAVAEALEPTGDRHLNARSVGAAASPGKSPERQSQSPAKGQPVIGGVIRQPSSESGKVSELSPSQAEDRSVPGWKQPSPSDSYNWGGMGMNAHSTLHNVWGPPNQDRSLALGNGTFDSSYNRVTPRQLPHNSNVGPIAPPSRSSKLSPRPSTHDSPATEFAQHANSANFPAQNSADRQPRSQNFQPHSTSQKSTNLQTAHPQPLASQQQQFDPATSLNDKPSQSGTMTTLASRPLNPFGLPHNARQLQAWQSLPDQIARQEREMEERVKAELDDPNHKSTSVAASVINEKFGANANSPFTTPASQSQQAHIKKPSFEENCRNHVYGDPNKGRPKPGSPPRQTSGVNGKYAKQAAAIAQHGVGYRNNRTTNTDPNAKSIFDGVDKSKWTKVDPPQTTKPLQPSSTFTAVDKKTPSHIEDAPQATQPSQPSSDFAKIGIHNTSAQAPMAHDETYPTTSKELAHQWSASVAGGLPDGEHAAESQPFPVLEFDAPPPPETTSHPAHDGDPAHPNVKIPIKPQVKIPNAKSNSTERTYTSIAESKPTLAPVSTSKPVLAPPAATNPALEQSNTSVLIHKIDALFARSGPQPPAVRAAIPNSTPKSATVSLPHNLTTSQANDATLSVTSKTTAEEEFMDERDMASLPIVRIPRVQHKNSHLPPTRSIGANRPNSKFIRQIWPTSAEEFEFGFSDVEEDGVNMHISLPNSPVDTKVLVKNPSSVFPHAPTPTRPASKPSNNHNNNNRRKRGGNGTLQSPRQTSTSNAGGYHGFRNHRNTKTNGGWTSGQATSGVVH